MFKISLVGTLAICCLMCSNIDFIESKLIDENSRNTNNVPHLVSIRYKKSDRSPYEHRCSGTIYSSKVILTTAACLISLDPKRLHVKAGSAYRTKTHGYLYLVEKYILHPDYNIWLSDNDLALLILKLDLSDIVGKEIANISLMDSIPTAGSLATKVGWGRTGAGVNSNFSEVLQISDVSIVNKSNCQWSYGEFRITQAMLCASGGANACSGDAGGALVYKNHAIGLKSWGFECGNSILPSVYTNLIYFKEWIENEVAKL